MSTDWAAVYSATWGDLVRFLYRKVWDADRAQDLAQEVFVRALDHEPDNPRSWLFTVATNLARDEARTAVRRRRHLELIRSEPAESPMTPEHELEAREASARIRAALQELAERDREVLLLWDAGLTYDEIAAETGLARGAVGTTLTRARKRLLNVYEAQGEIDEASG